MNDLGTSLYERREAVLALVNAFTEVWTDSDFGPAHTVISDYNLLNDNFEYSRNIITSLLDGTATPDHLDTYKDRSPEELKATLLFIDMLALIPEDWRDIHEDADNEPE